jgi:hypothetical protein
MLLLLVMVWLFNGDVPEDKPFDVTEALLEKRCLN